MPTTVAASLLASAELHARSCASRPVWMVGPCTGLAWNTSTPPTLANDTRNGTLDVGANSYALHLDLTTATATAATTGATAARVDAPTPFFAVSLRAVAGRCVGRLLLTAGGAAGGGGAPGVGFGASHVNITAHDPPVVLTNVAGRAWAAPHPRYTDWVASVYMPFADQVGGPCTFVLAAGLVAAVEVPPGGGVVPLGPGAGVAAPRVATWSAGIAAPTQVTIALGPAMVPLGVGRCDLAVRLRGPAGFMGRPASWDGNISLTAGAPSFTTPGGMLGYAGGRWTLELRPHTACPAPGVRITLVPARVFPVPSAAVRITGGPGVMIMLALPHRSPPFSYAGVAIQARAGFGVCEDASLTWLGDTFAAPGTRPVPLSNWSSPAALQPIGTPTLDPSVVQGGQQAWASVCPMSACPRVRAPRLARCLDIAQLS